MQATVAISYLYGSANQQAFIDKHNMRNYSC